MQLTGFAICTHLVLQFDFAHAPRIMGSRRDSSRARCQLTRLHACVHHCSGHWAITQSASGFDRCLRWAAWSLSDSNCVVVFDLQHRSLWIRCHMHGTLAILTTTQTTNRTTFHTCGHAHNHNSEIPPSPQRPAHHGRHQLTPLAQQSNNGHRDVHQVHWLSSTDFVEQLDVAHVFPFLFVGLMLTQLSLHYCMSLPCSCVLVALPHVFVVVVCFVST